MQHLVSSSQKTPKSSSAPSGFGASIDSPQNVRWLTYLEGMARGDEHALARLCEESRPQLYARIHRVLRSTHETEEVLFDVLHQAWLSAERFDSSRGSVIAWLSNLATSRALDRLRRLARRQDREQPFSPDAVAHVPCDLPRPDERRTSAATSASLQRALRALPGNQRRALELVYLREMTPTQAARQLRLPLGTVKSRIRLGLQKLAPLLEVA